MTFQHYYVAFLLFVLAQFALALFLRIYGYAESMLLILLITMTVRIVYRRIVEKV